MAVELLLSIAFNIIPIGVALIPYLAFRKKRVWGSFYLRLLICFSFFWVFYDLVPAVLFQVSGKTSTTLLVASTPLDVLGVLGYYLTMTTDIFFNIFNFLISSWPFIFVGAPMIAVVIIALHLRGEKGGVREKFFKVGFEFKDNPLKNIRERLENNSWGDEKALIKLLIVLLPLSLYLLTGVLSAIGGATDTLAPSSELGWFIEVFIVYLLVPITAVHLLYYSKASYEGRFFGDKIRRSVFYYLISIGAVLSGLSIILFIQQNPASISTIIYFVSYYAMSTIVFAAFLPVYEAVSAFLLVKISNAIKKEDFKNESRKSFIDEVKSYTVVIGLLLFFIILALNLALSILWTVSTGAGSLFFNQFLFENPVGPNFIEQISLEFNIILSFTLIFIGLIGWSAASSYLTRSAPSKMYLSITISFILSFLITIIILNIDIPFIYGRSAYWVVPAPASINIQEYIIFTPRMALLQVPSGTLFRFAAYPFDIVKALFSIIILSTIIYYRGVPFKTRLEEAGTRNIGVVYSKISFTPSFKSIKKLTYLLTASENTVLNTSDPDVLNLYNILKEGFYIFPELVSKIGGEEANLYLNLRRLSVYNCLSIYQAEFNFIFYKAVLKSFYIVSHDGRSIFSYSFSEELTTEPVLVAGMLSAISSFVRETTKSRELLRSIDHGDTTLLVEYGKYSFAALLADRETTELRGRLQKYIVEFEKTYEDTLANWNGDVEPFEKEAARVAELFTE
ncbi:MAG: hypothetical protein QW327_02010 [Candidatus Odinarchaeota archaeon]